MAITVGDRIPDVTVLRAEGGGTPVSAAEILGHGKVVLFAVPGAFTPTCSDAHLPGFVIRADDLRAKGVETVACVAMNDAFVMAAWGAAEDVGTDVVMLSDGTGELTGAMGMQVEIGAAHGLGTRSKRYAAIIEDGVVRELFVEPKGGVDVSSADAVLGAL